MSDLRDELDELGKYAYSIGVQAGLLAATNTVRTTAKMFPECAEVLEGLARAFDAQAREEAKESGASMNNPVD